MRRFVKLAFSFVLLSAWLGLQQGLVLAQESLPSPAPPNFAAGPRSSGGPSLAGVDASAPRLNSLSFQTQSVNVGPLRLVPPADSLPGARQTSWSNSPQAPGTAISKPRRGNWARRHATLLAGVSMVGVGSALLATGGPGYSQGTCFVGGPANGVCVPPGPVWLGDRRFAGVIIAGVGIPVTILGLLKH